MERIVYRITLDAHKNGIQRTLQGFETADKMSRQIAINLMASGTTYELPLDHIEALMYVTTPDATEPSINSCIIEGNTILYDVLPEDIAIEGTTELQLKLVETRVDGARSVLVSPRIALEVIESDAKDEEAEQNATFSALENAISRANEVYNSRLVRVEIGADCVFRVYYADGSVYENHHLYDVLYNGNALLSESYAHGNTGIREGENTDNSLFYSNVSKSASQDAQRVYAESNEMLSEARLYTSFTSFNVNFNSGNLDYLSANYTFDIDEETGNLIVENEGNYDPKEIIGSVIDEYIAEMTADMQETIDKVNSASEITGAEIDAMYNEI